MQIGISTAAFYARMLTEDAILAIYGQGAEVCEVFLDSYCEYEPEFGHMLAERVKGTGMRVVSIHAMSQQFEPQLFSLSVRQRKDAEQLFEKVLKQGRLLGAQRMVFHGPALLRGALRNAEYKRVGPIISQLAEQAAAYGIRLAWENVSWCLFSYPEFASEILEYVESENLGFTLDIKQAARSGRDPFEYVKAMGERLCHVHLCDYDLEKPGLGLCLPGKGTFDFARLFATLNAVGYGGAAMIEPYSDNYGEIGELGEALAAMRRACAD